MLYVCLSFVLSLFDFFFFFKQKTAYEMRISDWSSDVCSSDLAVRVVGLRHLAQHGALCVEMEDEAAGLAALPVDALDDVVDLFADAEQQIGRASCRERVCQYV